MSMGCISFMKRSVLFVLLILFLLTASACRTRIAPSSGIPGPETDGLQTVSPASGDPSEKNEDTEDTDSRRTKENPEAERREYDENASAEIADAADLAVHTQGKGDGAPLPDPESTGHTAQISRQAEKTATQILPSSEAERMGISADAEAAESALTYYSVLLQDRVRSMYECKKLNLYWESAEDHVTVHKSSPEHALIQKSGAYDVSSRLLAENLQVDDGWVVRKNPQIIVKIVDARVLGNHVTISAGAETIRRSLMRREGWDAIEAVKENRVLLLSEELFASAPLQTAAALAVAKTASPSLFEDVDLHQALEMLFQEASGTLPSGLFFYGMDP